MDNIRYIGLDVHRDTISVAVLNESGRLIQQSVLMTRAAAILDFIGRVRGTLHVTFEEGTHSAWLPVLEKPPELTSFLPELPASTSITKCAEEPQDGPVFAVETWPSALDPALFLRASSPSTFPRQELPGAHSSCPPEIPRSHGLRPSSPSSRRSSRSVRGR